MQEDVGDIQSQCATFVASCYGFPSESNMTSLRYMVWTSKMANHKLNSTPNLRVLPPTREAFDEHVCRAHLQAAIWKCALDADPPDLDPVKYGWSINADTNKLEPIALPVSHVRYSVPVMETMTAETDIRLPPKKNVMKLTLMQMLMLMQKHLRWIHLTMTRYASTSDGTFM